MVHLYFGWFFVLHKNSQENPLLNASGWFYLSLRWRSPMTWNARVWRLLWSSRHQRPCDQKSVDHDLNSSWVCFGDTNCVVRCSLQIMQNAHDCTYNVRCVYITYDTLMLISSTFSLLLLLLLLLWSSSYLACVPSKWGEMRNSQVLQATNG